MPCDECKGRGWYTDPTGKPGSIPLAESQYQDRMRPETCGACRFFVARRAGRPGSCGVCPGNDAYDRLRCVATDEGCRAGLMPDPVVQQRPAMFGMEAA